MTITLEAIKAEQSKIADMIAALERQVSVTEYRVADTTIKLAGGERYAGLVLGENGEADYHLVLLPGEAEDIQWQAAHEWATEKGGLLPTRREQSLLYANLKSEFQSAWYWSDQEYDGDGGWAWCQDFYDGDQDNGRKGNKLRARAVRRLVIL